MKKNKYLFTTADNYDIYNINKLSKSDIYILEKDEESYYKSKINDMTLLANPNRIFAKEYNIRNYINNLKISIKKML